MNRFAVLCFCACSILASATATAATLTVGNATIQRALVEGVFTQNGRWYLQDGVCYVYLESPRTWLADGRVHIEAQLSSQLGVEMSGSCVGTALASKVVMSGRLVGAGTTLALAEVRIDRIENNASGGAVDLLQSMAVTLPPVDVLKTARERLAREGDVPISVDTLQIDSVTTSDTAVTVRFDLGLRAP
jgi:hypothetical protein